jgi:AraC-like DNA-binding protein
LAAELRISREHLCRSFKAAHQVTVTDYIRSRRIQQALVLIEEPHMQLKEVGHAVGYSTYNEFFRAFKRVVRMTPTAYLSQLRA